METKTKLVSIILLTLFVVFGSIYNRQTRSSPTTVATPTPPPALLTPTIIDPTPTKRDPFVHKYKNNFDCESNKKYTNSFYSIDCPKDLTIQYDEDEKGIILVTKDFVDSGGHIPMVYIDIDKKAFYEQQEFESWVRKMKVNNGEYILNGDLPIPSSCSEPRKSGVDRSHCIVTGPYNYKELFIGKYKAISYKDQRVSEQSRVTHISYPTGNGYNVITIAVKNTGRSSDESNRIYDQAYSRILNSIRFR